jgi:hypothetical protein
MLKGIMKETLSVHSMLLFDLGQILWSAHATGKLSDLDMDIHVKSLQVFRIHTRFDLSSSTVRELTCVCLSHMFTTLVNCRPN